MNLLLARLQMTLLLLGSTTRERLAGTDREAGQTSAEYIGIIAVVVAIIVAVLALTSNIASTIANGISTEIGKVVK